VRRRFLIFVGTVSEWPQYPKEISALRKKLNSCILSEATLPGVAQSKDPEGPLTGHAVSVSFLHAGYSCARGSVNMVKMPCIRMAEGTFPGSFDFALASRCSTRAALRMTGGQYLLRRGR